MEVSVSRYSKVIDLGDIDAVPVITNYTITAEEVRSAVLRIGFCCCRSIDWFTGSIHGSRPRSIVVTKVFD